MTAPTQTPDEESPMATDTPTTRFLQSRQGEFGYSSFVGFPDEECTNADWDEIELAAACQAEFMEMFGLFYAASKPAHQAVWTQAIGYALDYWRGQFPGSRDVAAELKDEAERVIRERLGLL